ncbi:putative holin [Pseudomonas sp. PSE14]|uniref:putative holin n=1 Tax=Pseudomonas sp. PSE14 TaxID=3016341 RepID=UPI0023D86083|nr:putative holin [Pseudomonas sp. PSE14]WEJ74466.1 putative holin [Pseudomonas sp. PSE14]
MSEAGAIAATVAVGFGGYYLLGIDVNALIGAFTGAMFFVVQAKDLSVLTRTGYFLVSWISGYYIAGELVGKQRAETSGLVASVSALLCVYMSISLLE